MWQVFIIWLPDTYWRPLVSSHRLRIMPWVECQGTSPMISHQSAGNKPLPEPMLTLSHFAIWRHQATMRYTPSTNEKSRSPRDNQLASLRLQISAWTNCVPNVCKMYQNKRLLIMSTDMPNAFHGLHNDVMKCEHFSHYWPLVRGIHRSPVNSPHKG